MSEAIHPFVPGEAAAQSMIPKGIHDTDARIKNSRKDTTGARLADAAGSYPNGIAEGPQPDGMAALQRAAKARLTGNSSSTAPGTATYRRNSDRG